MKELYDVSNFKKVINSHHLNLNNEYFLRKLITNMNNSNDLERILFDYSWNSGFKNIRTFHEQEHKVNFNENFIDKIKSKASNLLNSSLFDLKLKQIKDNIKQDILISEEEWLYLLNKKTHRNNDYYLEIVLKNGEYKRINRLDFKVLFKDDSQKIFKNTELMNLFLVNFIRMKSMTLKDTLVYKEHKTGLIKEDWTVIINRIIESVARYAFDDPSLIQFSFFYLNELKRLDVICDFEYIESDPKEKASLLGIEFLHEVLWDLNRSNSLLGNHESKEIRDNVLKYIISVLSQYESIGLKNEEVIHAKKQVNALKEDIEKLIALKGEDEYLDNILKEIEKFKLKLTI